MQKKSSPNNERGRKKVQLYIVVYEREKQQNDVACIDNFTSLIFY